VGVVSGGSSLSYATPGPFLEGESKTFEIHSFSRHLMSGGEGRVKVGG
jgi:hypothetical protein